MFTAPRSALATISAVFIAAAAPTAHAQCQPQWRTGDQQGLPGANAAVQALLTADPDGDGPQPVSLIASGAFTYIGTTRTGGVAYWNSVSGWTPMGRTTGSSGENFWALTLWNNQVIVAGGFGSLNSDTATGPQPRNIAAWNGTQWVRMSTTDVSFSIQAAIDFGGTLYTLARDASPTSSPVLQRYVPGATTQTGSWTPIPGTISGSGTGMAVYNNELYIFGNFRRAATPNVPFQVAKLNAAGNDVIEMPQLITTNSAGVLGGIVYQGELYVYGSFSQGSNPPGVAGVAKWNPSTNAWVPATTHPSVASVQGRTWNNAAVLNNTLYLVGVGSSNLASVIALNGTNGAWSLPPVAAALPSATPPNVQAVALTPDGLSLALGGTGFFGTNANTSAGRIAFWNPATNAYAPVAAGFMDTGFGYPFVNAAATLGSDLYLGGSFFGAGTQAARSLAKFDGTTLTPVPNAPTSEISLLWPDPSTNLLYLATTPRAQVFNGTTFTDLPSTPGIFPSGVSSLSAITKYNGNIVVGTGSNPLLATLVGSTWQLVGGVQPNASVTALTTWSNPLVAGGAPLLIASGAFTQIGALQSRVAAWDGATWRALGQPSFAGYSANPAVSLFVHNNDLYMSAYFITINGVTNYPYLVRYNPTTDRWDEVPRPPNTVATGFGQPVRAISHAGSIWVAVRGANMPQMNDAVSLLRFDGAAWSNLGGMAGLFSQTTDLAVYNNDVILTGLFGTVGTRLPTNALPNVTYNGVGGVNSVGWARLQVANQAGPLITTQPQPRQVSRACSTTFAAQGTTNAPPLAYQWQFRTLGAPAFTDVAAGSNDAGRFSAAGQNTALLTLSNVGVGPTLEFRAIVSDACGSTPSAAATLQPCIADYNCTGVVTVQDIFDYLTAWFAGNLNADVNASGTLTVQDIFDYLTAWFVGC